MEPDEMLDASRAALGAVTTRPTAFLLVTSGRMARWPAFALGLHEAGGSRPELAVGFKDLFVFP